MSNTLPNKRGGEFNGSSRWNVIQKVSAGILTLTTMFGSTGCDALSEQKNDVAVVAGMICKDKQTGELTPPAITGVVNLNIKNSAAGVGSTDKVSVACSGGVTADELSTNVIPLTDYKRENLQPHQVAVLSKGVLGKNSPLVSFRKTNDNTAILEINGSGNIIAAEGATKLPGQCK